MSAITKNILFHSWLLVLFSLNHIDKCNGDICATCSCSNKGTAAIIDCHEKLLRNVNKILPISLMLDERQNVEELILSKNNWTLVSPGIFINLKHVKKLDLSDNLLPELYANVLAEFVDLNELSYSNNKLRSFDNIIFDRLSTVAKLNLSRNRIEALEATISKPATSLISLDLSYNRISLIGATFLKPFSKIRHLNLSFNEIAFVPENAFSQLSNLKTLAINNNFLTSLKLSEMPKYLTELCVGYNKITKVFYETSQIRALNIEFNNISRLENDLASLSSLEHLNVSGNALTSIPNVKLERLRVLDISNNNYSNISKYLSSENYPQLNTLIVSGNPIRNLSFYSKIKLRSFVASNIAPLEKIDNGAFFKLEVPINDCINLTISNNEKLIFIDERALDRTNACFVDLSNNKMNYISPKLFLSNGTLKMRNGIDLQGNPFTCDCSLQWMLSDLIPQLYVINPSILDDLRCAAPPSLLNKRMVHWYKWEKKVFCEDTLESTNFSEKYTVHVGGVSDRKVITFESSSGLIAILGAAIASLTILVAIGILMTQRLESKRSRKNRRF